jgi:hypothetical protein
VLHASALQHVGCIDYGGADLMLRGRGATRTCWPTQPLSAEQLKAQAHACSTHATARCNESTCTFAKLFSSRAPSLLYACLIRLLYWIS